MSTTLRRFAALSVGSALALTGLTALTQSPASADASPSGTAAGTWLSGELTNGLLHNDQYDFDDIGLSVDAALAELALGNTAAAAVIRDAVAPRLDSDWLTYGDPTQLYAGSAAKALVFAQGSGANPTSYGGRNLVTTIEDRVGVDGRLRDLTSGTTDYSNTIGQSFAVQGLTTAASPEASAATSFLLKQQCPAGFFRAGLGDVQCGDSSDPQTDSTALAVLGLQGQTSNPAVATAVAKAVSWLTSVQAVDGSFVSDSSIGTNANSTGLAAWALGESCATSSAVKAATYLRGLQIPGGTSGPLSGEVGAIAYDPAAKTAGQGNGITAETADQWRRATSQAAPALAWDPTAPATVTVSAPGTFIKGGTTAKVTITGASAGERVCVTDSEGGAKALTGTGGPLTYDVPTRKKQTGAVTVSATTGPGSAGDEVQVLGKKRLKPKVATPVHRGAKATVKLKGLGAKEKVKVLVDGKKVDQGKATKKGAFTGRFLARLEPGKHKLKVVGQFGNRVGVVTFRVVR